jgi:hypothetical protein
MEYQTAFNNIYLPPAYAALRRGRHFPFGGFPLKGGIILASAAGALYDSKLPKEYNIT